MKGTAHVNREAYGLDRYVEALLVARISNPRVLKKLRETPADTVDTRALRAELAALGKREDTLGRNYATGKITERVMNGGMEEITARKAEIDAALERVGQRTPLDPFKKAKDAKDVARASRTGRATWTATASRSPGSSSRATAANRAADEARTLRLGEL